MGNCWARKLGYGATRPRKQSDAIFSRSIRYTIVTDRHTDRQTDRRTDRQTDIHRTMVSTALTHSVAR